MEFTRNEKRVLQMAGFKLDEVDAELLVLTKRAIDSCYYLDHAVEDLLAVLKLRRS